MKRFSMTALAGALALSLGACGVNDTREDYADETDRADRAPVATQSTAPARATPKRAPAPAVVDGEVDVDVDADGDDLDVDVAGDVETDGKGITGVGECDEYLSRYRACHRVIGAYDETDIEKRYQSLRASLLERSLDPAQHESLAQGCSSLASTMEEALNDRECVIEDAPVADSDDLSDDGLEDE